MHLLILCLKHLIPLHELVQLLHRWFEKTEPEIEALLRRHDIDGYEVEQAIVKSNIRPVADPFTTVLRELVSRLSATGLSENMIKKQLLAAGFTENELYETGSFSRGDHIGQQISKILKFHEAVQQIEL